jgi:uncharacterized protein
MKNVIGVPARGKNFFPRDREIAAISEALKNDDHVLIDCPRREGKTTVLHALKDQQFNGDFYAFLDTRAIRTEADFFEKLYKELCEVAGKYARGKHLVGRGRRMLQRLKSFQVSTVKLELSEDHARTDYKEEVRHFLRSVTLPREKQLIIMLDEFPETVLNIIANNPDNPEPARQFLQSNCELRSDPSIYQKVKFIITGSVSLQHVVAGIGCSSLISDLVQVKFGQLTIPEAQSFLRQLLSARGLAIPGEASDYLLNKIEWLSPYHIQLMVQQLIAKAKKDGDRTITVEMVDAAFRQIANERSNSYFQHYHNRLQRLFKGPDLKYAMDVLNGIARRGVLSKNTILRLSDKYQTQISSQAMMHVLVYDGYVRVTADNNGYRFNSPIAREWWKQSICK